MSFPHAHSTVALLTDFGTGDGDVGVMKGVIAGIAPDAHIIDLTHDIAPQNIASAAWVLTSAYRYFPTPTVFICVVDPGVGSSRGAIALHAGDWFFVGPDNGLFSYVLEEQPLHSACILSNPVYHLPQISSTFHGRDIFAPAGAHLANGIALSELGTTVDPTTLQCLNNIHPTQHPTGIEGQIIHVDRFGNLITNIPLGMVPGLSAGAAVRIVFSTVHTTVDRYRRFFADGPDDGQPFIYGDSSGYVGVAVRNGNAARVLQVGCDAPVTFVTSLE